MRKKVLLIISIISVLIVSAISFASCFEHHLRPVGTYQTYEYTNEETGKSYRVLLKFVQEEVDDKKGVSGKVHYAYQLKRKGEDVWKTEYIYRDRAYQTINANKETNEIATSERLQIISPDGEYLHSVSFGDNFFKASSSFSLYKVPLETLTRQSGKIKYSGYKFVKSDETFPDTVYDFSQENQNNG